MKKDAVHLIARKIKMASRHVRFFGLLVERKTDVLALAAFLISVATIVIQSAAYFQGSEIKGLIPTYLSIYENPCSSQSNARTEVVVQAMALNVGQKSYSEILRRVFLSIEFEKSKSGLRHYLEVSSEVSVEENKFANAEEINCSARGSGVILEARGETIVGTKSFEPQSIQGGGVYGRNLLFTSTVLECSLEKKCPKLSGFLDYVEFLKELEHKRRYRIVTVYITGGGEAIEAVCSGAPSAEEIMAAKKYRRVDLHCETDLSLPGK